MSADDVESVHEISHQTRTQLAADIAEDYLEARLPAAEHAPGVREAVIDTLAVALNSDLDHLVSLQLDQLRGPSSERIPDAYLAYEAAAEDALQRVAAGMRNALARAGHLVNARTFERRATQELLSDPRLALRAELARIPRPNTRSTALHWSCQPAPWANQQGGSQPPTGEDELWPPADIQALARVRYLAGGSVALARVDKGPYIGWVQIGLFEQHSTPARRYPRQEARRLRICLGLEATDHDPPAGAASFATAPWQVWTTPRQHLDPTASPEAAGQRLSTRSTPLIALTDGSCLSARRQAHGAGAPLAVLAPILDVITALDLAPTSGVCGLSLSDSTGPALISRHWRTLLTHDDDHQPRIPVVEGTDVLLRPDLFSRLRESVNDTRFRVGIEIDCRGFGHT